ncbi:hypothetical protein D1867_00825 [Acidianus infernus]|uniref:CobQ/CobB/MinD/ParA nucleotide binding domain-containing protein n=1 Tax=Acidianus infernus TaxID=12915 RepID=A0A6A9Q9D9_ACIIN|nr:ParA family protein [Acidianus infernus]MUM63822.1 hypothetical protein [Acidianus infernus]
MIRITFVSPKGGVGKSTIIYYVAKLLSDKFKTLIVDLTDSATLSRLFGVQNNILADNGYFADKGNIGVISFSRISNDETLDLEKITLRYKEVLGDYSLVLVEYPIHFYSKSIKTEYMIFNSLLKTKNYLFSVTIPQDIVIKSTLNYTSSLISYLSSINKDIYDEALIINMIKDDETKDITRYHSNVFSIKFNYDLIFKGFYNVNPPNDFLQISKFIENLIE